MDGKLSINTETCIKCGKCARVCPSQIITQETKGSAVKVQNVENCHAMPAHDTRPDPLQSNLAAGGRLRKNFRRAHPHTFAAPDATLRTNAQHYFHTILILIP